MEFLGKKKDCSCRPYATARSLSSGLRVGSFLGSHLLLDEGQETSIVLHTLLGTAGQRLALLLLTNTGRMALDFTSTSEGTVDFTYKQIEQ